MNVKEAIYARRAIRRYAPRDVDTAMIEELLRAAVQAPTAMNLQPWLFVVIQDREALERLSDLAKQRLLDNAPDGPNFRRYEAMLRSKEFNIFYDAGTLIVIGASHAGPYSEADCWLAAENLMLAACDAGLGTCCIGFALDLLNEPAIKAELSLPDDARAVAAVIVGYPLLAAPPVPRAEPRVVCWRRAAAQAPLATDAE